MHFIHSFIKNVSIVIPQRIFKHFKSGSIFLEEPEDDSVRIETCCLNKIINIIKVLLCLTDTLLYIYICGEFLD